MNSNRRGSATEPKDSALVSRAVIKCDIPVFAGVFGDDRTTRPRRAASMALRHGVACNNSAGTDLPEVALGGGRVLVDALPGDAAAAGPESACNNVSGGTCCKRTSSTWSGVAAHPSSRRRDSAPRRATLFVPPADVARALPVKLLL
eukprot:scaffold231091_cov30-Tisochrysis_lutea.AAC.3